MESKGGLSCTDCIFSIYVLGGWYCICLDVMCSTVDNIFECFVER